MSTNLALLLQSHHTANNENSVDDEQVLPEQFFTSPMTARSEGPELLLARAILEDAIHCYQRQWISSSRVTKKLAREAKEYIFSDDTSWPFSFVNLCEVFSLSPSYIRAKLQQRHTEQNKPHIHKKRHLGILRRPLKVAA